MKILIFIISLFFCSSAWSDVTATWTPGVPIADIPVDEYQLFCAPFADPYGPPVSIFPPGTSHTFVSLDGVNKCRMTSVSNNNVFNLVLTSTFSQEVVFFVSGGVVTDPFPNAPSLVIN